VRLAELNALEEDEFVARLGAVFEHSPWVAERAWQQRPFRSIEELHRAMISEVRQAQFDEQLALVRAHPELAGREAGAGALTEHSSSEQERLGFTRLDPATFEAMKGLNKAYRDKFGFPCIVALALRGSRDEVMHEMQRRLQNDTATELRNALEQVAHIARARLEKLVRA
jgi:2-oxo-4-hydroxy-4-carboxy-5-ureidoimidazoline decarboxylase